MANPSKYGMNHPHDMPQRNIGYRNGPHGPLASIPAAAQPNNWERQPQGDRTQQHANSSPQSPPREPANLRGGRRFGDWRPEQAGNGQTPPPPPPPARDRGTQPPMHLETLAYIQRNHGSVEVDTNGGIFLGPHLGGLRVGHAAPRQADRPAAKGRKEAKSGSEVRRNVNVARDERIPHPPPRPRSPPPATRHNPGPRTSPTAARRSTTTPPGNSPLNHRAGDSQPTHDTTRRNQPSPEGTAGPSSAIDNTSEDITEYSAYAVPHEARDCYSCDDPILASTYSSTLLECCGLRPTACIECFDNWIKAQIRDSNPLDRIHCMEPDCKQSLSPFDIMSMASPGGSITVSQNYSFSRLETN
jgi:hypothetical protein